MEHPANAKMTSNMTVLPPAPQTSTTMRLFPYGALERSV